MQSANCAPINNLVVLESDSIKKMVGFLKELLRIAQGRCKDIV